MSELKLKPLACGFHSHAEYSLDGGSTVAGKISHAAKLGRVADCLTDHGIMSGLVPHWMAVEKMVKDKKIPATFKSIHGIEAYLIDDLRGPKEYKNGKIESRYYHITIHFKTLAAYQYFCQLTPKMEERAIVKYGERKPLMTMAELEAISGQITLGSGCLGGPVQQNYLRGRPDWAVQMYEKLRAIAGPGNFFVEVFPHIIDHDWQRPKYDENRKITEPGFFRPLTEARNWEGADHNPPLTPPECVGALDIQKGPNEFVMDLAKKYGDPVIISLDDHYGPEDDRLVQEARLGNGQENWKFYGSYASHTSEHCCEMLQRQLGVKQAEVEEWIDNSYKFVENFDKYELETHKKRWLLPATDQIYEVKGQTNKQKLWELILMHGRLPAQDDPRYGQYVERMKYEVSVLADNGTADFLSYFFVLEDVCRWAKKNGILWNVRGSAGGSLILFLLGVSITDPIKYDLPFERFLTLGRIKSGSLPDVDTDWPDRDEVFSYIREKYGDAVALISTDMMLRLKSSILDAERAILGHVRDDTSFMCKLIPGAPQGTSDNDWLFGFKDKTTGEHVKGFWDEDKEPGAIQLRAYAANNPEIWKTVLKCIGLTKTRGIHAGGVVIAPGPVHNFVPVIGTDRGSSTAYNMKGDEYVGLVKYDFLGVSTLKAIEISLKSLRESGLDLEWREFDHDDRVYTEIIHKMVLAGIFQINTDVVKPGVLQTKPMSVRNIATLTALFRPGALDAPSPDPADAKNEKMTAAVYFMECAQGLRKPYFIHPDLEKIATIKETYGVLVFQEQTIELFEVLAKYNKERGENVRRGIGKKDEEVLAKEAAVLRAACLGLGWTEDQAAALFTSIMASARYSFNRSHSASYAIVAYNGCWLKYNHPLHFWKGILEINTGKHEKLKSYFSECRHLLLPIDVMKSDPEHWLIEGDKIRPPLSLLKGCGDKSVSALLSFLKNPLTYDGRKLKAEDDADGQED